MIKYLKNIYRSIFGHKTGRRFKLPAVYYDHLTTLNKTPTNDQIREKDFIMVVYQKNPHWALFRCPCGCHHVISLSLQRTQYPSWTVQMNLSGRPTVYPSVKQVKGCRSHFWIKDGRVYWV